jgi:hypothetical protein
MIIINESELEAFEVEQIEITKKVINLLLEKSNLIKTTINGITNVPLLDVREVAKSLADYMNFLDKKKEVFGDKLYIFIYMVETLLSTALHGKIRVSNANFLDRLEMFIEKNDFLLDEVKAITTIFSMINTLDELQLDKDTFIVNFENIKELTDIIDDCITRIV